MNSNLVAKVETNINTSVDKVWLAFTDTNIIKQYMFGTEVQSDWKEGSSITWKGEWQGKKYEDKGKILEIKPKQKLRYSHFSPLSGLEDIPSNYHNVTIELNSHGDSTTITLSQDNNASEESKQHSEKNWNMMLASLKHLLEGNS